MANLLASLTDSLSGEPNLVEGLLSDRSSLLGAALLAERDVVVVVDVCIDAESGRNCMAELEKALVWPADHAVRHVRRVKRFIVAGAVVFGWLLWEMNSSKRSKILLPSAINPECHSSCIFSLCSIEVWIPQ